MKQKMRDEYDLLPHEFELVYSDGTSKTSILVGKSRSVNAALGRVVTNLWDEDCRNRRSDFHEFTVTVRKRSRYDSKVKL